MQSGQTNNAFLLFFADTSLGVKAFLSLHMAAALGHSVAKSLMPEMTFLELTVLVFMVNSLSPRIFEVCKIKIAAIIFTITASYMSKRRVAECHAGIW